MKSEYIIPENNEYPCLYTDEKIDRLFQNEIFVFGSNLQGHHAGGAARAAMQRFGAIWGQGVGLQGNSYAIPTMQGGVETIKPYIDEFIRFAEEHKELHFLVTRIGCGIAGFKDEDIAPLFTKAQMLSNVSLPWSFIDINDLFPTIPMPTYQKLNKYGQAKTLVDIIKVLNERNKYTDVRVLENDFHKVIMDYEKRGTVDQSVCYEMMRSLHELPLMRDGFVDIEQLAKYFEEDEETIYGRSSDLSAVFSRREKTKIIRIAKLINDVKHYTDSEQFIYELTALCSGRWNCGDNHYMNDSFHYPLYFVRRGLTVLWNELTTNGVLDNNKLEQVMFTEHEKRVNELGLRRVIEEDYQQDGPCHPEVYFPNKIGTAPVYVVDRHNREHCTGNELFVKSCGEGKGPNAFPNRYEFAIIRPIIEQEVEHGNYVKKDGYYIPTSDWRTKPIFHEWEGRIDIIGLREKRRFIQQIKEGTADRW